MENLKNFYYNIIKIELKIIGGISVAKSKRSNFLIDKPFQLGFIFRYLVIILLTIIIVLALIAAYYWFISNIGEYKLNTLKLVLVN